MLLLCHLAFSFSKYQTRKFNTKGNNVEVRDQNVLFCFVFWKKLVVLIVAFLQFSTLKDAV